MTTLWMAPYTCARVTAIALEEAGVEFDTRLVRFMRGEHKSPEFRARNPTGKVPALEIDGDVPTENVAILTYLAERKLGYCLTRIKRSSALTFSPTCASAPRRCTRWSPRYACRCSSPARTTRLS